MRWGSVITDCSKIHFHESIVEVSGKQVRRKETKTGVERWFTCPARLQALLRSIRPSKPNPDSLVFVSPKGGAIGESNFASRGWKKVDTVGWLTSEVFGLKQARSPPSTRRFQYFQRFDT